MAIAGLPEEEYFAPGHRACAGCGAAVALRLITKAAGKNTILVESTGCMEVVSTPYPETSWRLPWIHGAFENNSSIGSGVERALKALGKEDVNVVVFGGDGGTYDIGFGAISGVFERGHNLTYICYDNEAYMNCLALSTDILTKDGLRKITEVKKGDLVYAFNQKARKLVLKKCTGVFDNGRKDVYELTTLHHNVKATINHPFLTVERRGRGRQNRFVWKTLGELKNGDQIIVLKNIGGGESYTFRKIRVSKKGDYKVNRLNNVKLPSKSSPDLMEFLGLFVGDGWVRLAKGEIGFALPEGKHARDRLLMLQERLFGLTPRLTKNYAYFNSVNLARFIDSLGFNLPAKKKTIPQWIYTLPADEKEAFIRGLMLSDGYRTGGSLRIVSASFELLKRTRLLLQTMGYMVGRIHKQRKKKGTHCVYRKLLKDSEYGYICFSERQNWNIEKYPSQYKYQNYLIGNKIFETERVQDIKFNGVEPTLDLRVEGEHNFIADGIVVHNTGIQRSSSTPFGAATSTSPAGKESTGKGEWKKDIVHIMAMHGSPYVAQTSIGFPQDAFKKIKTAIETKGPTYVNLYAPCPTGWRHASDITVEIAKLAVDTGVYPIYEIITGKHKITRPAKIDTLKPVEDYLKLQGRFRHLFKPEKNSEVIDQIQKQVTKNLEYILKCQETGL